MSNEIPDADMIALAAMKIADDVERDAYIQRACGGNEELQRRVRVFFAEQVINDSLAATLAPGADGPLDVETKDYDQQKANAPSLIGGRYRLLKQIGEGGMGSVWAAEQREPVTRTVALKLIKKGMDSAAVLARFDAERQALALMDHPNIARIFDGGISESGSPFFAMELVQGQPITDFCDKNRLTPQQRLELFIPVCKAIQHAHHKGIIHRDIKPSNVLVMMVDDRPVPKVIDFGVAKATGQALTELSLDTGFGIVGTPQYMSPEQASMNHIDIDTRSDVYSLGVLLYELLAGSTPFRKEELAKAGYLEILRVIREVEPPRPSTKLSTADTLPNLSAARSTDPKRLSLLLRNELDWIVMRALEKDRSRRYETANAFAADINRYLHGEPVQAHPPTVGYRLKKFLRKNRAPAITAALVTFALIAGCIGTSLGMLEARRQAGLAIEESKLKEAARKIAERERVLAEQRLISARQAISAVVNNIPNLLERVPLAAGAQKNIMSQMEELLSATGSTGAQDARFDSSRSWGLMAVETRAGQQAIERGDLEIAELHYRNALRIAKEVYDDNPRDPAKALGNMAMAYALLADLAASRSQADANSFIREAIRLREEALNVEQAEDSLGKRRASLGNAWNRLASIQTIEIEQLPIGQRQAAALSAMTTSRTALQHLETAIDDLVDTPADQSTARRDQVAAAVTLAKLASYAKDLATVIEAYELAKSNLKLLVLYEPERIYYRVTLAEICGSYGDHLLVSHQDPMAARVQYVDSMKLLRELNGDTQLELLKQQRIIAYYRLGLAAESQGNAEQVRKYFERACLLSDLHLREKSDQVRDPELLIDEQVQLMLEQAWAGQSSSAVITARNIKSQLEDTQQAREKPWAADALARAAFTIAIAGEKGGLSEEARKTAGTEALQTLQHAIATGFNDVEYLHTDPDVAPLRRVNGFDTILQKLIDEKK
jgi:serine/threonine protein kinase